MFDRTWFARALHWAMAAYVLSGLLGVWAAYDPGLSLAMLAVLLVGAGLYAAAAWMRTPARAEAAGGLLALAGLAIAVYFIAQYGHQPYRVKSGFLARLGQATTFLPDLEGPFLHPNTAASFLVSSLPVAAALALTRRRPLARGLWLAACAALGYAFLLTASRGAWLALGAAARGRWRRPSIAAPPASALPRAWWRCATTRCCAGWCGWT